MKIVPSGLISTLSAPVCCAARIARATSAWVTLAGVRLIARLVPGRGQEPLPASGWLLVHLISDPTRRSHERVVNF